MDVILIFLVFFVLMVISVLDYKKIKDIKDYSKGYVSFSTFSLFSTIVATWVSGSSFFVTVSNTYKNGISYFIPSLGMVMCIFILGHFIAPKLKNHLGEISVASYMKKSYKSSLIGKITALCGFIGVSGSIAIQLKVIGKLFIISTGYTNELMSVVIGTFIVLFYTTIGGINSVVKTDKIQFVAFFISLPVVGYIFGSQAINTNNISLFHFQTPYEDIDFLTMCFLFLYFAVPAISPTDFQRLTMGITSHQVTKSYKYAALFFLCMKLIMLVFPVVLFSINQNLEEGKLLPYIIDNFTHPIIKPIFIIGIAAMAMSTADSMLNIGSVLIVNDFLATAKKQKDSLLYVRCTTLALGLLSLVLSVSGKDLLSIILFSNSFYMPIITPPLFLSIFGYKVKTFHIFVGMISSFLLITIMHFLIKTSFPVPILAMILNIVSMILSYLFVEKWEWLKPIGITSQLKKE